MTTTKKFSQFNGPDPIQNGDIVVGLRAGPNGLDNWQFTGVGSGGGGGGGVTQVITQANTFVPGNWVRVDIPTMLYVKAQADTIEHAEVIGIVINATASEFTLQQAGYIDATLGATIAAFGGTGFGAFTVGDVYFLDTATQGAIVPVDATVNGEVSRPVFVADGPVSGWVVPYRGLVVGGAQPNGNAPTPGTDTSIVVINQNGHNLNQGDVVRVDTQNVAASAITYVRAKADTLANAQAVGVVISPDPQNPNQFTLQFSGYNTGAILTDAGGGNIKPATVYYLSPTVDGRVTDVNPTLLGQISKPIYISEQGQINFGVSAGYIMPQRPLSFPTISNNTHTVTVANAFNVGQVVYIDHDTSVPLNCYKLAKADTLKSSQVAGIVIAADPNQFTVQQSGWINGAVTGAFVDTGAPTSGDVLYLSATNAGNLTAIAPSTVGQYTKPVYVQETAIGRIGEILPQRPLVVSPGGGGGGGMNLIISYDLAGKTDTANDLINILNGTYQNISIVISNLVMQNIAGLQYYGQGLALQVATNGTLRVNNDYWGSNGGAQTYFLFSSPAMPGGVQFWTNEGVNALAQGGKTATINIDMAAVSSNTTYKIADITYVYFTTPNTFIPSRALQGTGNSIFSYGLNTADHQTLTGFKLFFAFGGFRFIQGTISVYGTVA